MVRGQFSWTILNVLDAVIQFYNFGHGTIPQHLTKVSTLPQVDCIVHWQLVSFSRFLVGVVREQPWVLKSFLEILGVLFDLIDAIIYIKALMLGSTQVKVSCLVTHVDWLVFDAFVVGRLNLGRCFGFHRIHTRSWSHLLPYLGDGLYGRLECSIFSTTVPLSSWYIKRLDWDIQVSWPITPIS